MASIEAPNRISIGTEVIKLNLKAIWGVERSVYLRYTHVLTIAIPLIILTKQTRHDNYKNNIMWTFLQQYANTIYIYYYTLFVLSYYYK